MKLDQKEAKDKVIEIIKNYHPLFKKHPEMNPEDLHGVLFIGTTDQGGWKIGYGGTHFQYAAHVLPIDIDQIAEELYEILQKKITASVIDKVLDAFTEQLNAAIKEKLL